MDKINIINIEVDELPPNCFKCRFGINGTLWSCVGEKHQRFQYACFLTGKSMTSTKRNRFCPLDKYRYEVKTNDYE